MEIKSFTMQINQSACVYPNAPKPYQNCTDTMKQIIAKKPALKGPMAMMILGYALTNVYLRIQSIHGWIN